MVCSLTSAAWASSQFTWRQTDDHVALVQADGTPVWQFNHPAPPVKPHFHPVGLPGEPPLTWLSPPDHPWHLGLWFSWKFINGRNYWEVDAKTGRSEGLTRVTAFKATTRDDYSAHLEIEIAYQPQGHGRPDLREHRVVEISAPAADGSYHLDWTMTFTAGEKPVDLDRTPLPHEPEGKPWGGYAGLIWRFPRAFTDWQVTTPDGTRDIALHGVRAPAADFSGKIDGTRQGVAILDHPTNPRAPTPWYVAMEHETPFACLTPAPLFHESLTLEPHNILTLRYRVIVHPTAWSATDLQRAMEAYAAAEDRLN